MPPDPGQVQAAQDNLRDQFFALAFDPDSEAAAARADEALRELDRLLAENAAPQAPAVQGAVPAAGEAI